MTVEPKVQSGEAADDYTPDTEDIQDAYKWLAWDDERTPFDTSIERFQRWLRKVKAEAWDEAHGTPCDEYTRDEMCYEYHRNPYRD